MKPELTLSRTYIFVKSKKCLCTQKNKGFAASNPKVPNLPEIQD
jgi:hypothetical protein